MGCKSILLVDDEQVNLFTISQCLRSYAIDVITASSGNQALDILEKRHFDMVVSDLNMPDGDGFDLCKKIREKGIKLEKLIAFSYSVDEKEKQNCLNIGFDAFVDKRFGHTKLVSLLQ